jgi:hypothetical protein
LTLRRKLSRSDPIDPYSGTKAKKNWVSRAIRLG